jgi:hypothetical protein
VLPPVDLVMIWGLGQALWNGPSASGRGLMRASPTGGRRKMLLFPPNRDVSSRRGLEAEQQSLISGKISLLARFNSLQGRKKFPVKLRRELARKTLILLLLCRQYIR